MKPIFVMLLLLCAGCKIVVEHKCACAKPPEQPPAPVRYLDMGSNIWLKPGITHPIYVFTNYSDPSQDILLPGLRP